MQGAFRRQKSPPQRRDPDAQSVVVLDLYLYSTAGLNHHEDPLQSRYHLTIEPPHKPMCQMTFAATTGTGPEHSIGIDDHLAHYLKTLSPKAT
jgi:hypothetical protein